MANLSFKQVEKILTEALEDYLEGVGQDTDENGVIDFGGGLGYTDKEELINDFIIYLNEVATE